MNDVNAPPGSNAERQIEALKAALDRQRAGFRASPYPAAAERKALLATLIGMLKSNRRKIAEALRADFHAHPGLAADLIEVAGPIGRAQAAIDQLDVWMAPESRPLDAAMFGGATAYMQAQPKGVIGLMVPWNFPFELSCGPLVDMLAAGNRVIIKPSEVTATSAEVLREIIAVSFDPDQVTTAVGGVELARAFPSLRWDHLLYTGSTAVGREVMRAAAQNLVPVTLELGGKCPAVLATSGVNERAIRSILGLKLLKSGQVCVSVDHVFVPSGQIERFVALALAYMRAIAPALAAPDQLTGIVSSRHHQRMLTLLDEARGAGTRLVPLEPQQPGDAESRRVPLTLVIDPPPQLALSREEIFGPLLPVYPYKALDDVIAQINRTERPLGIYVYSEIAEEIDRVVRNTVSGGVTVNGAGLHPASNTLGFGGVGASGMGRHHGIDGFREFSNPRAVLVRAGRDNLDVFFPPYGDEVSQLIAPLFQD